MGKPCNLKEALLNRAKAKNAFIEIANNKSSKKTEILDFYKKYRKADDALMKVYEGKKDDYPKVA